MASSDIDKPVIPEIFPGPLLAIPITSTPLFPHTKRSITLSNPYVIQCVHSLIANGQPYIGIFLSKDNNSNKDTFASVEEVHHVGVFASIDSSLEVLDNSLQVNLDIHRRIKINRLRDKILDTDLMAENENKKMNGEIEENTEESGRLEKDFLEKRKGQDLRLKSLPANNDKDEKKIKMLSLFNSPVTTVLSENVVDQPQNVDTIYFKALMAEVASGFRALIRIVPEQNRDQMTALLFLSTFTDSTAEDVANLVNVFASQSGSGNTILLQNILESTNLEEKLKHLLFLIRQEITLRTKSNTIQEKISNRLRQQVKLCFFFLLEH